MRYIAALRQARAPSAANQRRTWRGFGNIFQHRSGACAHRR